MDKPKITQKALGRASVTEESRTLNLPSSVMILSLLASLSFNLAMLGGEEF